MRYERDQPGDLIHIDIKKIGKISGVVKRFTNGIRKNYSQGWEYVHAAVDDHSRVAYVEVLPDEKAKTFVGFLLRALRFFKGKGVKVWRVMTDNGVGYVAKKYAKALRLLNIKHPSQD